MRYGGPVVVLLAVSLACIASGCASRDGRDGWSYDGRLHRAIQPADRVVVRDGGRDCCGPVDGDVVLFQVADPSEVKAVFSHIEIKRHQDLDCCDCCGWPGIDWYQGGRRIALTALKHGRGLAWEGFPSPHEVKLTERSARWLRQWLTSHGVPTEEERQKKRSAESDF